MIKFIPHRVLFVTGNFTEKQTHMIYNETNKEFADRLTEMHGDKYCTDHPEYENLILVDIGSKKMQLVINDYFSEKFKPVLDAIISTA